MRLQHQANRHRHPSTFCIYCFNFACCDFQAGVFCFDNYCLEGTWDPFVPQVQTARMAQGVSDLLGVAFYNSRGGADMVPSCRTAKGVTARRKWLWRPLVLGCWEREMWRLQAFANRKFGILLCALRFVQLSREAGRILAYKFNPKR